MKVKAREKHKIKKLSSHNIQLELELEKIKTCN